MIAVADRQALPQPNNYPLAAASDTLEEAKRYLQKKWKRDRQQFLPLEYVVKISTNSGVVKNIDPQGYAARTFIERTKLIQPGDRIVSPTSPDNSDRQIRAILQPDGRIEVFENDRSNLTSDF
jgi:hypothetical protein